MHQPAVPGGQLAGFDGQRHRELRRRQCRRHHAHPVGDENAPGGTHALDVRVGRKIPVAWVYLTGWATRDGAIHFRDDIYGHDEKRELVAELKTQTLELEPLGGEQLQKLVSEVADVPPGIIERVRAVYR